MSKPHCIVTHDPDLQGQGAGFSAEASAVLAPHARTPAVRVEGGGFLGDRIAKASELARLMGAAALPVSEPGEEGYGDMFGEYTLDEDGWGDQQDTGPAYSDPAEVLAVHAQRLANVRRGLSMGRGLSADDIAQLHQEEVSLLGHISMIVAGLVGGEE